MKKHAFTLAAVSAMMAATPAVALAAPAPASAHAPALSVTAWYSQGPIRPAARSHYCITAVAKPNAVPGGTPAVPVVGAQAFLAPCVKNDAYQEFFSYRLPNSGQSNLVKWPHLCLARVKDNKARIIDCDKPGKYTSLMTFSPWKSGTWTMRITVSGFRLYVTGSVPSHPRGTPWVTYAGVDKNRTNQQWLFAAWHESTKQPAD